MTVGKDQEEHGKKRYRGDLVRNAVKPPYLAEFSVSLIALAAGTIITGAICPWKHSQLIFV